MRIIDVDGHLHEPLDWIEVTDPALAKELGTVIPMTKAAATFFGVNSDKFNNIGKKVAADGGTDTVTLGMQEHLQMTDDRQPAEQKSMADDPYCGMEGRLKFCDEGGIDIQFLNPTFMGVALVHAAQLKRPDLMPRIRRCWNKWAANLVQGHTDRMMPVAQLDFTNIPEAIKEMTEMRKAGSRSFVIPQSLVPTAPGQLAKPISHPDFDPLWSAAVDLGMAAVAHVGFAEERINPAWANDGTEDFNNFTDLSGLVIPAMASQLLIGSMVFGGAFERHPKLTFLVEEVGISWLPALCDQIDRLAGRKGKMPRPKDDGEYRPAFEKTHYRLPLAPTEYIERNVWVTPLVAQEPLAPTIDMIPDNILCFSSDYPHIEGSGKAVAVCDQQLEGFSQDVRESFYNGVGKAVGL